MSTRLSPSPRAAEVSPPERPPSPTPLDQRQHDDQEPSAKRLRTEYAADALSSHSISSTLKPALSSTDAAGIAAFVTLPSDVLVAPQPLVAAPLAVLSPTTSPPLPDRPNAHRRHRHRHRHRRREAEAEAEAGDVEYQPMAGDDADDDVTLMIDDLQRVEGEEEEELLALRQDQDIDIDELRRRLREAGDADDDGEDGEAEADGDDDGDDSAYSDDEDAVDINDLPRLKDLQTLQQNAVRQGLPLPSSLLSSASLNVPFPPKPRPPSPVPLPVTLHATAVAAIDLTASPSETLVVATEDGLAPPPPAAVPEAVMVVEEEEKGSDVVEGSVEGEGHRQVVSIEASAEGDGEEEVTDATERELLLSRELGVSVAAMRSADLEYEELKQREQAEDDDRRERHRQQKRREREADRAAQQPQQEDGHDGYASSSSSSPSSSSSSSPSDSSDSDSDADSTPLSPYSAAFYTSAHSFYPAKTSRVGPLYQPDQLPHYIDDPDERLAECHRNVLWEGHSVGVEWDGEAPPEHVYWQVEARRQRVEEERRAKAEEDAARIGTVDAALPAPPEEAAVHQPAVRSQRSSAKRAREYIATVASTEITRESNAEAEGRTNVELLTVEPVKPDTLSVSVVS